MRALRKVSTPMIDEGPHNLSGANIEFVTTVVHVALPGYARERRDLMRRRANRPRYIDPITFARRECLVIDVLESWNDTNFPYGGNRAERRAFVARALRVIRKVARRV